MIKIHDIETFCAEIERRVTVCEMEYLEAIISYMKETGLDEIKIKKLLSPALKVKLQEEANNYNRLGKRQNKLDV